MANDRAMKVYFVVGEASGDALGSDLMEAFAKRNISVEFLGLGGPKMIGLGLEPLFNSSEISVMGLSEVIAKLPSLLAKAKKVANDVIAKKPDILLLIDSPDFAKRVAKRVKQQHPDLPVVKYVCPSVWSWRPGRAAKMKAYVDHVLAILPFEPQVMKELGGPLTTYVGHPLARLAGVTDLEQKRLPSKMPMVMLMPGSRRSEVARLMPILRDSAKLLLDRGFNGRFVLPAVPHLFNSIETAVADWSFPVELITEDQKKYEAMAIADAAIAASGTATLELAMYGVPMVSIYKLDPMFYPIRFLLKAWTGALPNLIADKVIVPERFNEYAHPGYICRLVEALLLDSPERKAQIDGFAEVHRLLTQKQSTGEHCVDIILGMVPKS